MSKTYTKPCIFIEEFVANDYIAACGQGGGGTIYVGALSCNQHGHDPNSACNQKHKYEVLAECENRYGSNVYIIKEFRINGSTVHPSQYTAPNEMWHNFSGNYVTWLEGGESHGSPVYPSGTISGGSNRS